MHRSTIIGWIAASVAGTVVLAAAAQQMAGDRPVYWPAVKGAAVVKEWYSDIPWHQKLGTFAGNEIDEPLILPYDALRAEDKAYCTAQKLSREDCMIEVGVINILGMLRTDTPYSLQDPMIQAAAECKDATLPCIEVKLELSSFRAQPAGEKVVLQPRVFGVDQPDGKGYYYGYVITDGSTYAPQMPWYMSHYCDSLFPNNANDVQDPVCYGDYFSPMNNGFSPMGKGYTDWPRSSPWSVYPNNGGANHCKDGLTVCTMVMAGFNLSPVTSDPKQLQYGRYNDNLRTWFNGALKSFATDFSKAQLQRHYPWTGAEVTWETFLYPQAVTNPFLGQFADTQTAPPNGPNCDVGINGPTSEGCFNTAIVRGASYLYPRQCTLADLAAGNVERLRKCTLNYELHHNGYLDQWPDSFHQAVIDAGMIANQYGRTSFLFAGVPGMQIPVSFYKIPSSSVTLPIYEQVYNASIFSLYMPIANVADVKHAFHGRNYTDKEFYHTLLMSNHMESDPIQFAEGIRGKTLWHNEYRTQKMYEAFVNKSPKFPTLMFAGAFEAQSAPAPYHNNTCDGCHVRNGSGIPINPQGKLDTSLQEFMSGAEYNPYPVPDYTFTGKIRPMKLVFFDLGRSLTRLDSSRYSEPLSFPARLRARPPRTMQNDDLVYNNRIMNFYGDSFHATTPGYTFDWTYEPVNTNRLVVAASRVNAELGKTYALRQVRLNSFTTPSTCELLPPGPIAKPWPRNCSEIDGTAIAAAFGDGEIGSMLLNGKRLGNLSAIEAVPNQAIVGFRDAQRALLGEAVAGEIIWNAGTRDGVGGKVFKYCRTNSMVDCYIGRFGWIGDRVSLEDQVANAAFVEMNMTTSQGYKDLYGNSIDDKILFPVRYAYPNCGPANKKCVESSGNGDLTELDVHRMAEYARWTGNPTRSEFKVTLPEVVAGEKVFRRLNCDTCHVIGKIDIVPDDTMVSKGFRDRLATRVTQQAAKPFLSYLGTDLLMHDMGYLSQVANTKDAIRDKAGVVLPAYRNYVQKIRTPALKGLRFNRFVTDSHKNTKTPADPACDFLLHDGRACDAIEAAFLHDGPAVMKLGTIDGLNALTAQELLQLRAFLYSL